MVYMIAITLLLHIPWASAVNKHGSHKQVSQHLYTCIICFPDWSWMAWFLRTLIIGPARKCFWGTTEICCGQGWTYVALIQYFRTVTGKSWSKQSSIIMHIWWVLFPETAAAAQYGSDAANGFYGNAWQCSQHDAAENWQLRRSSCLSSVSQVCTKISYRCSFHTSIFYVIFYDVVEEASISIDPKHLF